MTLLRPRRLCVRFALRRIALANTQFGEATCDTIRLKLFEIGALVAMGARGVGIAMGCRCVQDWRPATRPSLDRASRA
jgi:hypothetical protein